MYGASLDRKACKPQVAATLTLSRVWCMLLDGGVMNNSLTVADVNRIVMKSVGDNPTHPYSCLIRETTNNIHHSDNPVLLYQFVSSLIAIGVAAQEDPELPVSECFKSLVEDTLVPLLDREDAAQCEYFEADSEEISTVILAYHSHLQVVFSDLSDDHTPIGDDTLTDKTVSMRRVVEFIRSIGITASVEEIAKAFLKDHDDKRSLALEMDRSVVEAEFIDGVTTLFVWILVTDTIASRPKVETDVQGEAANEVNQDADDTTDKEVKKKVEEAETNSSTDSPTTSVDHEETSGEEEKQEEEADAASEEPTLHEEEAKQVIYRLHDQMRHLLSQSSALCQ